MPLVVIVDELDRCRPTYAIEMLERIKHLFSVPNVVFVLGADFVELGKSIQAVYGEINTDKYLERLIQYRFELPRLSPGVYLNSIVERCNIEGLVETHCEQGSDGSDEFRRASVALATLRYLANSHSFSLREVEHLLRLFQVGVLNSEFSTLGLVLLAMVCVLKLSNPEVLDAWINGSKDHNVVVDAVLNTRGCHFAQPDPIRELFAYLVRVGQLTNNLELESISEEFYQAYGLAEKRRPTRALGDKYVEAILQGMRRTTEGRHIDFGGPWVAKYVKRLQFVFE